MAVVSPLPQTYALNLSTKPESLSGQGYPPSYCGKPVQRVQPNDCHQIAAESPPIAAVSKPRVLLADGDEMDLDHAKMPNLIIPRKQRSFIPEESKDFRYWDRRRKNNDAAKRSRQKRRLTDIVLEAHVLKLAKENDNLKAELQAMRQRAGGTDPEQSDSDTTTTPSRTDSRNGVPLSYETSPYGLQSSISLHTSEPDGCVSLGSPMSYPVTSVYNPYQHTTPKSMDPNVNIVPPVVDVSNGIWPSPSAHPLVPSEDVDLLDRNVVSTRVMPWQLERIQGHISNKFDALPAEIDSLHRTKPFFIKDQPISSPPIVDLAFKTSPLGVKKAGPVASPPPQTQSVHNGTSDAQGKTPSPPSPHSAFTSGVELSKLPHKLREKMKRSILQSEEAGNCKETTGRPPHKIQRVPSLKETTLPLQMVGKKDENCKVTSLNLDSYTPPPSSCSPSESAASPFVVDPLFDFSQKTSRPSSKTFGDSTLNEAYEQMVRAAHALTTLNRGTPEGACPSGILTVTTGTSVPVDDRDKYWDKRRRNNQAAKKCRDAKRLLIEYRAARSAYLEQENTQLRQETSLLQAEVARLKELVKKRLEAEAHANVV